MAVCLPLILHFCLAEKEQQQAVAQEQNLVRDLEVQQERQDQKERAKTANEQSHEMNMLGAKGLIDENLQRGKSA